MKPCQEYLESIALLAARSLDSVAKEKTERHLESCRTCRDHFENLRRVCGQLERVPRDAASGEMPSNFHRRLVERVRADVEKSEPASASVPLLVWSREWLSWPRVAYAGAFALVLLLAVISLEPGSGTRDPRIKLTGVAPPVQVVAPPAQVVAPPAPTLMALSRALNESEGALDSLLARQEQLLAANDPPSMAMANSSGVVW
jgi:hypothetical protein